MYKGVCMTVRKNFVFDEETAIHLEELSKREKRSQTALVQELIEKRYRSQKVKKRLEAFDRSIEIAESFGKGLFSNKTVQSIKEEMDV